MNREIDNCKQNISILRGLVNKYPTYPEKDKVEFLLNSYENENIEDMNMNKKELSEHVERYKVLNIELLFCFIYRIILKNMNLQ